ncbi:CHAT domain-containing protein [Amycolatopsis sp. NPDC004625]|uniref:CHAT domain-containing protein n=1 Tax=Amycolatopsis sp. NPDC004625 TaxID=3154670 RepID=UPI0033A51B69
MTAKIEELRLRAALLSHYELPWLGTSDELAHADGAELFSESARVRTGDGHRHWALHDAVRRSAVRRANADRVRAAWKAIAQRPEDDRQWAIDHYVGGGSPVDLDTLPMSRLRAVAWLARWLGDSGVPTPDTNELVRELGRGELLEPLRALAGEHFVGRQDVLWQMADQFRGGLGPLLLHGAGGIGKSALAARYLLAGADRDGTLIGYLNFDNSVLEPAEPVSLVAAIARQLTTQLAEPTEGHDAAAALATRCHELMRISGRGAGRPGPDGDLGSTLPSLVAELADLAGNRRTIVVFDTFEEVQRRDLPIQQLVGDLLAELQIQLRRPELIIAGRAPVPWLGGRQIHLIGLPANEAVELLSQLLPGEFGRDEALRVVDMVGGSPLALHLAAAVLRSAPRDSALQDIALHRGTIEGELYRRLLGHIADPDVRRIAHPGLTLRRVTPELIRDVLARPCGLSVRDDAHAEALFQALAREAMLVTRVPGQQAVIHRADVRSTMLRRLAADEADVINQIHRAAISFYRGRTGVVARAEELYHRLMLGQSRVTLDQHWDDSVLSRLTQSVQELPPASKAYLASKSATLGVSDEDLLQADAEVRRKLVIRRASQLIEAGNGDEALHELNGHDYDHRDESALVGQLWIQALRLTARPVEALDVAVAGRRRAARDGAVADFVTFTLDAAGLLEQVGRAAEAKSFVTETLTEIRRLPQTQPHRLHRLELVVALLRLRRYGLDLGGRLADELAAEAIGIAEELPIREITKRRTLLRDLAAEVGERSPWLLDTALRTLGLEGFDADLVAGWSTGQSRLGRFHSGIRALDALNTDASVARTVSEAYQSEAESLRYREFERSDGRAPDGPRATLPVDDFSWLFDSVDLPRTELDRIDQMQRLVTVNPAHTYRMLASTLDELQEAASPATAGQRMRLRVALGNAAGHGRSPAAGLTHLEIAAALLSELPPADQQDLRPSLETELAVLLHRLGRPAEALTHYDTAIRLRERVGRTGGPLISLLLNRGMARMTTRDFRAARQDLAKCARLARQASLSAVEARAQHMLGDLALLEADIPQALQCYERAERGYREAEPDRLARLLIDQARGLLAAGLAEEADNVLDELLPQLRASKAGHDLAEAELTNAAAKLLLGSPEEARHLAESAQRRFARRKSDAWAEVAALTRLRAATALVRSGDRVKRASVHDAVGLAERLELAGLPDEASVARMLGVQLALAGQRAPIEASDLLRTVRAPGTTAQIDRKMLWRLCHAELAVARGDHRRAFAQARQGLAELGRARDRLGGLDLLTGVAVHGYELGQLAVDLALADGRPRSVFGWLERTRAQAYRYRPLSTVDAASGSVEAHRLRSLARELANAESENRATPELRSAYFRAQQEAITHARAVDPFGLPRAVATLDEVKARLGERALVILGHSRDKLSAVVVTRSRTRLVQLGTLSKAEQLIRELSADVDALAPDNLPQPLTEVVRRSAAQRAALLDNILGTPITDVIGDRELVIVPTGILNALPWSTLPSCTGRPIVIAPSATAWLLAEETPVTSQSVTLVSGPAIEGSRADLSALSGFHPVARILNGPQATVDQVLEHMEGAGLAHLAAHGTNETGNTMFSRLELADGSLFAYELARLRRCPQQAILVACDVGATRSRLGDEFFGFAGALLLRGSARVVAPLHRVGDQPASETMVSLHREIARGRPMAQALAQVVAQDPFRRPYVCLGSG